MTSFSDETISTLQRCVLFSGVDATELRAMLSCLSARIETFSKDERIYRVGDEVIALGIVIRGSVLVGTEDYWGNSNINAFVGPSDMFAEAFACTPGVASMVNVVAAEESVVVMIDVRRIVGTCSSACGFHQRLIRNLLAVLAKKDLSLTRKVDCLAQRTTRDKVLAYLSACAQQSGSASFDIPFNRQQLADYLAVERSALSSCLGKMKKEGVIDFDKNRFVLK